jgi:trimeric autotransporter adhesin
MRQSKLNDISARLARGALVMTAVSVLSLHAMAQSSDGQKPLPSPIFAAAPAQATDAAASAETATPSVAATVAVSETAKEPAPVNNRMTGFAAPSETANALSKPALPSPSLAPTAAASATVVAAAAAVTAPVTQGATSRAGIARLNKLKAPAPTPQHPAAAAYPGYDVIVCIAGCGNEAKVVSVYKPKPSLLQTASFQGGAMHMTMSDAPLIKVAAECVAGCYDSAPQERAAVAPANVPAAVPSARSPAGATDRAIMVPTSTGFTVVTAHPKPKAKSRSGSEWFTRRFQSHTTTHTHTRTN